MIEASIPGRVETLRSQFVNEMMWDSCSARSVVRTDQIEVDVALVAQKKGLTVGVIEALVLPVREVRNRIARQFAKLHHEFILIWNDHSDGSQIWQSAIRKGRRTHYCEVSGSRGMGDHLEKLADALRFEILDSDIEIVDVVKRRDAAFTRFQQDYLKRLAVSKFEEQHGTRLSLAELRANSSCWLDEEGRRVVSTYSNNARGYFWFGLHDKWIEFLKVAHESTLLLVCADVGEAYAVPFHIFHTQLANLNKSRTWYHLRLEVMNEVLGVRLPKSGHPSHLSLEQYRIPLDQAELTLPHKV